MLMMFMIMYLFSWACLLVLPRSWLWPLTLQFKPCKLYGYLSTSLIMSLNPFLCVFPVLFCIELHTKNKIRQLRATQRLQYVFTLSYFILTMSMCYFRTYYCICYRYLHRLLLSIFGNHIQYTLMSLTLISSQRCFFKNPGIIMPIHYNKNNLNSWRQTRRSRTELYLGFQYKVN